MINPSEATFKPRPVFWPIALLLVLILLFLALHAVSLRYYPPVFVDEAILISRAWAWLQTGLNFGPLDAGVFEKRFDGYWTFNPLIPTWFHAMFVSVFGLDLSLLRFASFLCGVGLLAGVFSIARQLGTSASGTLMAVLLVITSTSFLISSHYIRYDMLVAAMSFGSIALYLAASRRQSPVLGILAGLSLGLAFEVHVNAVIYGPVIVALAFAEDRWQFVRRPVFWAYAGGVAVALMWYLWAHVIRYPEAYFGIGRALAGTHSPPLLSLNPTALLRSLADMGHYFLLTHFRLAAASIAALLLAVSRTGMTAALMFAVGALVFAILIRNKMGYYLILIEPFADIVLALWIEQFLVRTKSLARWQRLARVVTTLVLVISLVMGLVIFSRALVYSSGDIPSIVARRIERYLPEGGALLGAQTYWFELHRFRYISWQNLLAHRMYVPNSTVRDAFTELKPDVLVIDDHLRQFVLPEQGGAPRSVFERYIWERRLPREEMEAFLVSRGTLREKITIDGYGTVEIYSFKWNE